MPTIITTPYTDNELNEYASINSIPSNAILIRTLSGGAVWVLPQFTETIQAYQTGLLTGGVTESAAGGVFLRVLPRQTVVPDPTTTAGTITTATEGTTTAVPTTAAPTTATPITILPSQTLSLRINVNVTPFRTIPINFSIPILRAANKFIDQIINNYVDEDRDLKTLINFGDDRQAVLLNYRYGRPESSRANTLQVKLLQPLQTGIGVGDDVFISRELNKTVIDSIRIKPAPEIDTTPYLRPRNTSAVVKNTLGNTLNNITLNVLKTNSGSVGTYTSAQNYSFEDEVYRRWYSFDFNSAELNIDFSQYNNFVFYGSAAMRLEAFRLKLLKLEELERKREQFSGNLFTGVLASTGAKYILEQSQKYSIEKENLIRSFDRYEQYLYFTPSGSNSPYSASFDYVDAGTEYNPIGYWPKDVNNNIISPTNSIADNWFISQSSIAQRFDEFNENNLVNTIPTHVREDELSAPYITFVTMVGHFFDLVKPYIDQYPYIYDRYINPDEKLSKDLITDIADAVGFKLPSFNTTTGLTKFFTDTNPERDKIVQLQKRILHNLAFFVKAKGSRSALNVLLRATGIPESILTVRESGPSATDSYYTFNEFSSGIYFSGSINEHLILPLSSSNRTPYPRSIQLNIAVDESKDMTILTGDTKWALNIKRHPTNKELGRIELVSGSAQTLLLSSSYQELFNDELVNVTIRTYPTGSYASLFVAQTYGEDVIFTSSMQENNAANIFLPLWNITENIYVGGSGSLVVDNFKGTLDEIRYWGINLSDTMTLAAIFDPGSNSGEKYTDPVNYLYGQISFNKIDTGSLPTFISNESPYFGINGSPSLEIFETTGFTTESFVRYNRTVRQLLPNAGSTSYLTTKIKIAPPPQFNQLTAYKTLSRTKSIVTVDQKMRNARFGNNKVLVTSSPTEIINQNIMRNLGTENINVLLGAPSDNTIFQLAFKQLKNYYEKYYYVDVNFNRYIRILSKLNSVLTDTLQYFIPSRASLYNGIVIEPNILDKSKISLPKKLRVYGGGTRKTLKAAAALTSSKSDYEATFNVSEELQVMPIDPLTATYIYNTASLDIVSSNLLGQYLTYTSSTQIFNTNVLNANNLVYDLQHLDWKKYTNISNSYVRGTEEFSSSFATPWPKLKINVGNDNLNKISFNATNFGQEGAEPYNRVYTRKLFEYEILSDRLSGTSSLYTNALYEIKPSCNFDEFETYTYFNQPYGIYYYPTVKYTPVYYNELNAQWNISTQQFTSINTWTYGARFNLNDVVYQNITNETFKNRNISETILNEAKKGNGKYYVFKNRPNYKQPDAGESWYSGSVPTFLPPSLDNDNWIRLTFLPIIRLDPRRVIFETFTVKEPSLNNYKTTTVDINRPVGIATRYVSVSDPININSNSLSSGEILIENISTLFALQTTVQNLRIRLYRLKSARDADVNRNLLTMPAPDAGVLLDKVVYTANIASLVNPVTTLIAGATPPQGKIYYTINNLNSNNVLGAQLLLYYYALEPEKRIPVGYLRKHYRFFRDNSTATKRRNYVGCINTVNTTIDGLPPVQIFVGEGTRINILPSSTSNEIIVGGGGTLNVT